jgi:CRP-like cAMP-binding protein
MAMLTEHTFGSTVVARGPVKALRLPRAAMHDLMATDPALADHMVAQMSARLTTVLHDLKAVDAALGAADLSPMLAVAFADLPARIAGPDHGYLSMTAH